MIDQPTRVAPGGRIEHLDVLRGLAVLGILVVNTPVFAMPYAIIDTPTLSPWPFAGASVALWWTMHTFFQQKFVTLFSLLFGVSVYLVGGERGAAGRGGIVLLRRLLWLIVFGLVHGLLIWPGDILLLYGTVGLLMTPCRSWSAGRLTGAGLLLMALGLSAILIGWIELQGAPAEVLARGAPDPGDVLVGIARMQGDWLEVQRANFEHWRLITNSLPLSFAPLTLGLMMLGLALFKTGVLQGQAPTATYLLLLAAGAAALAVIGWNATDQVRDGFPVRTRGFDLVPQYTLAPVVTLGYVALVCLGLRGGWLRPLAKLLAPVGRMAFTNYIAQSLIMTAIFYGGGRGLGLYGRLDWPQWALLVLAVWVLQVAASALWLKRFSMGPLEWVWRRLSYGRPVPLRRSAAREGSSVSTP